MTRHKLSVNKVFLLRRYVKNAPFNWREIDFTLGRGQREDGSWCFWLRDGKRIDIEFHKEEIVMRATYTFDSNRPQVAMQTFTREDRNWYYRQLKLLEGVIQ